MRLYKGETAPEWLDPSPRLRGGVFALKRITVPENPSVTRC